MHAPLLALAARSAAQPPPASTAPLCEPSCTHACDAVAVQADGEDDDGGEALNSGSELGSSPAGSEAAHSSVLSATAAVGLGASCSMAVEARVRDR